MRWFFGCAVVAAATCGCGGAASPPSNPDSQGTFTNGRPASASQPMPPGVGPYGQPAQSYGQQSPGPVQRSQSAPQQQQQMGYGQPTGSGQSPGYAPQGFPGGGQGPQAANGSITGTVTYYFNSNFGNKPDVGSEVYLLSGDWSNRTIARDQEAYFAITGAHRGVVKKTAVDGNGNYRFDDLPPGLYTVFLVSNHANDTPNWSLALKKCSQETVTVRPGETTDSSEDMGMSEF